MTTPPSRSLHSTWPGQCSWLAGWPASCRSRGSSVPVYTSTHRQGAPFPTPRGHLGAGQCSPSCCSRLCPQPTRSPQEAHTKVLLETLTPTQGWVTPGGPPSLPPPLSHTQIQTHILSHLHPHTYMHTHVLSCLHPTLTHMYTCPLPPPSLTAQRLALKRMGLNIGVMGWSRQDPLAETHHPAFKSPPPGSPRPMNAYRCHLPGRALPLPSGWGLTKRRGWGSQRPGPPRTGHLPPAGH